MQMINELLTSKKLVTTSILFTPILFSIDRQALNIETTILVLKI
jgi:hypothetical protein